MQFPSGPQRNQCYLFKDYCRHRYESQYCYHRQYYPVWCNIIFVMHCCFLVTLIMRFAATKLCISITIHIYRNQFINSHLSYTQQELYAAKYFTQCVYTDIHNAVYHSADDESSLNIIPHHKFGRKRVAIMPHHYDGVVHDCVFDEESEVK